MEVYVQASSKAELNQRLATGRAYGALTPITDESIDLATVPEGTVVRLWAEQAGGLPVPVADGVLIGGRVE